MATAAPSIRDLPRAYPIPRPRPVPRARPLPRTREASSDPLDFFRGLALALPLSLLLWAAIFRVAWWAWRG